MKAPIWPQAATLSVLAAISSAQALGRSLVDDPRPASGLLDTTPVADTRQLAQAGPASYEFRGTAPGRQGYVDHIWILSADGRITGRSTERIGGGQGGYSLELTDDGRWQARAQEICIEWNGSYKALSGCYSIERHQGFRVRLRGPKAFEGTLEPTGETR